MKIGMIGLGKLGYPCSIAMCFRGHHVLGYDVDPEKMTHAEKPYQETGPDGYEDFNSWLSSNPEDRERMSFVDLEGLLDQVDIVFVSVQTPHNSRFDGTHRLDGKPQDFDYSYLLDVFTKIRKFIKKPTPIGVISTVLPGTVRKEILPLCNDKMGVFYNPSFIAMGTTMRDFLNPEFVLTGFEEEKYKGIVEKFWSSITDAPLVMTTLENAELTKNAYNTYIGMKIVFANTLMEICHKIPKCDVDVITNALALGTRRIVSSSYFSGGMGDGGGCHPRDNIALSWLAKNLELKYDWFESVMLAREDQTEWLVDLMCEYDLPKMILGFTYKPQSNIIDGSPAILAETILLERGIQPTMYDPHVERKGMNPLDDGVPRVVLVGTKHKEFVNYYFPPGCVVIDPWRYIPDQKDVQVIRIGQENAITNE